jgi:hypothetical protein
MPKTGRPSRAGERATARIELRLTLAELRAVRALARANGASIADTLRLTVLELAADAGERTPIVLGRRLLDRLIAGNKSASARRSDQGD